MNFYNKDIKTLYKELETSKDGLSSKDATNRLEKFGANKIEEGKKKTKLKIFLEQFNDMMIIILIIVAIVMWIYGILYSHEYTDTIVIAVVVLLNAIMGFIQEEKAEVTLESLKKYATSTCKVRRNGKIDVVNSEELVPGDIMLLEAGDKIPADARIVSATNLKVDESPLTGESLAVSKNANVLNGKQQLQTQSNMLFCGCNIVNGHVEAIVVRTGMTTELGLIATSLNTPYEVSTPLQIKIKEISKKITILVFLIILFMFFYGVINGYKVMEIIMLCVSLAVAAIPEGLPAVITIALSSGTGALAKKKTIVRQMSAVETLGSTDIICSDKTGTITQNKMTVKKVILTNEEMAHYVFALANETILDDGEFVGDPTETSLFDYLVKNNIDPMKLREENPRLMDAPFDSDRKMMSSINEVNGKKYIFVKGSLDTLLDRCVSKSVDGKISKLTKKDIDEIRKNEHEFASSALRVLGLAYREVEKLPKESKVYDEENDLIYVGMVGMIDPPRDSVKDSVKKCKKAGIRPIMITGDSLITACAIAKEVGIIKDESEGLLGDELDKYTDEELCEVVKKYNVYARVSPTHKVRIVAAWQKNGKVVAMTGDGVNDAPAIKDAHVGVGMGITGTEVTKSVADVILLDDSFSTIVVAVEEGRRIFANIRNNVVYSLSSNFAELFTVLIGMFTGHTILLPIHILFIDLVTDTIPSICLSFEKSEKGIMDNPPRGIEKPIFTPFVIASIIYSAVIETIFALTTYFVALKFYNAEVAASVALLSIVVQEIIYAITCRNLKQFTHKQGFFSNKAMNIGLLVVIAIELIVFLTPIGSWIDLVSVNATLILKVVGFNLIGYFLYEISKPILKRLFKD